MDSKANNYIRKWLWCWHVWCVAYWKCSITVLIAGRFLLLMLKHLLNTAWNHTFVTCLTFISLWSQCFAGTSFSFFHSILCHTSFLPASSFFLFSSSCAIIVFCFVGFSSFVGPTLFWRTSSHSCSVRSQRSHGSHEMSYCDLWPCPMTAINFHIRIA